MDLAKELLFFGVDKMGTPFLVSSQERAIYTNLGFVYVYVMVYIYMDHTHMFTSMLYEW